MARLDPAHYQLAIAGTGIEREAMERQCEGGGIRNIKFLGHIGDRDELADLVANADIFIHPNPNEPFGIAPLEAMAAGLAVIVPNSGGVISYANENTAWLGVPDPDEFATAARLIRADAAARRKKIIAARDTAETFHWPRVTSRFLQLYRDLIEATRDEQFGIPAMTPHSWVNARRLFRTRDRGWH